MKKLLTLAVWLACSGVMLGAQVWNPFSTNRATAYPSAGQVPVFGAGVWGFGTGGSATNLSPWSTDIDAANFSLTNASTVSATNITGDSTIARTNANHFALSVTNFQGITGQGGFIVTNNSAAAVTFRNGINLIGANVTTTIQPDSQSLILEPAGSGNLPDFIFYTNGNFRFPGVAINGFGRTLQDYIDVSNAITNAMTNGNSVWYGDGSHLSGITGGTASNAIANFTGLGTNTQFYATGTSNIVLDVIAQSLNTGTSSVTSVDWQSRILFGTDGLTGISWGTGALVGNGSGLTNVQGSNIVGTISAGIAGIIPAQNLPSALDLTSLTVGTLTATNTYLTNGYYFHTNATTGQWGYWDTNGVHFESNFLSGVWWWRGPTNSMSGVVAVTNWIANAVSGSQTNAGTITSSNGFASDPTHFIKMPTNTPSDGQAVVAVGTAGDTKFGTVSGASTEVWHPYAWTYNAASGYSTTPRSCGLLSEGVDSGSFGVNLTKSMGPLTISNMLVVVNQALGAGTNLSLYIWTNGPSTYGVTIAGNGAANPSASNTGSFYIPSNTFFCLSNYCNAASGAGWTSVYVEAKRN